MERSRQPRESGHPASNEALNRRIELHTCRQHHSALRHILGEFPDANVLPGPVMIALLSRLKNILYRHLKLEDDYVYPALALCPDEELRTKSLSYRMEMGGIMRAFEDFDERWPHAEAIDARPDEFLAQWAPLRAALEARMDTEDALLYPDAERYFNDALRNS